MSLLAQTLKLLRGLATMCIHEIRRHFKAWECRV